MERKPKVTDAAELPPPHGDALHDVCPDRIERLIEALARCAAKRRPKEGREDARRRT